MNSNTILDDIQWQTLIQQTAATFSDVTIKRGFQYYKQGRIAESEIDHTADGIVNATVDGSETYRVELYVHALDDSHCSCPVQSGCKHMVAVLLDYANRQGRSIHALVNAHSTLYTATSYSRDGLSQTEDKPLPAGAMKWKEKADRLPEMPVSEWHDLFEICTASLGSNTQNSFYAKNALASLHHIKPPLTANLDTLFDFHALLFVLGKLVKPPGNVWNSSGSYIGYHTQIAADHVVAKLEELFKEAIKYESADPSWGQLLAETIEYVRRNMLLEQKNRKFYTQVYAGMWMNWIYPNVQHERHAFQTELNQLESAEAELAQSLSPSSLMIARSMMHLFLEEDREALDLLRQAEQSAPLPQGFLINWFQMLYDANQWNRLARWLSEISPLLGNQRNAALAGYQHYWNEVVNHLPEAADMMWDSLVTMLPSSKDIYQEALIDHGKWREWMDYQLSTGVEPLELRVSELAPIEKHAPELLLPFYHQAVERYILHKNRAGYKAAVKLLKRLAKLYKKLKQQERWEGFILSLSVRNSRLRALQEELRRGKLIT
ncbi:hypothetical protein JCM10914A_23570 [Paenibacillus sp. JCM 10914]